MNPQSNFIILLFAEPSFLSTSILEQLLANNCYVNIVSDNAEDWMLNTQHIVSKNKFSISRIEKANLEINYSYVMFCSGFTKYSNVQKELSKFLKLNNIFSTKTFVVLPKEIYGVLNINNPNFPETVGIIYVKDILGPRISLDSDLTLVNYLNKMYLDKVFDPDIGETFSPLFVSDVSRQIVKWLFAFGPFGKETLLQGEEISSSVLWQISTRHIGQINYSPKKIFYRDTFPRSINKEIIKRKVDYIILETLKWICKAPIKKRSDKPLIRKKEIDIKFPVFSKSTRFKSKIGIAVVLSILAFPIISFFINALIIISFYKPLIYRNSKVAASMFSFSKKLSSVSYKESSVLKNIPFFGQIYKEMEFVSFATITVTDVATKGAPIFIKGETLFKNILGQDPYSIENTISELPERLQVIYEIISKAQNTTIKSKGEGSVLASYTLKKVDLDYYKNIISQGSVLSKNLSEILGDKGSRTYLLLFQNNMELRPTGGFIGSYGLVTFDKGRLSDFAVSDIYSADGQLNGHVEPPTPIKNYLGEANWWFRDSNWDPDFPTSARRAEWFLDKSTDKKVDGVVSVDLAPVKDFLDIIGSIYLSDYEINIDSNNFYEKVQSEVENNFFPGTYKKKSFLTSLSMSLLNEIKDLSFKDVGELVKLSYKNLNSRRIQLYLHNSDAQKALSALNWDGGVLTPFCGSECLPDLIGIVEANVGVNKSNYFISRKVDINMTVNEDFLEKELTLTLKNSANGSLGVNGRYKTYTRLLIPEEAYEVSALSVYGQDIQYLQTETTTIRGRKEVGVLVEVLAGETKNVKFKWKQKNNSNVRSYYTYFRKQAGVDDYPFSISINTPVKILGSTPPLILTEEGNYIYNTTLVKDLIIKYSL